VIIAIDPSIAKPGWAVLRVPTGPIYLPQDVTALYVDSGQWGTEASDDPASRLAYLAECCTKLCAEYPPTRAFVEEPAVSGLYGRNAGKAGASTAIVGRHLGAMQRATGVFLAVLGAHCPTVTVKATNPLPAGSRRVQKGAGKLARRSVVASYWPFLAERPEDEIDAIHLALTTATDARRQLWKVAA